MKLKSTQSRSIARSRWAAGVGALVVSAFVLAGCSGTAATPPASPSAAAEDWDAVVAAANKEGAVTVYTTTSQVVVDTQVAAFEAAFPAIKVTANRIGSGDLPARLEQERTANAWQADVVSLSDPLAFDHFNEVGYVDTNPGVPEAANWPAEDFVDGAAKIQLNVFAIAYNTDLVSEADAPKDWDDLLDPRWKGHMALHEAIDNGDNNLFQYLKDEYGDDYLTKLGKQDPVLYASGNPATDATAAGQHEIVVGTTTHYAQSVQDTGAPIAWVRTPKAPANAPLLWAVPADKAHHPNAAKVFLNYFMSMDGQQSFLGDGQGTSVLDVPGMIPLPPQGIVIPDAKKSEADIDADRELLGLPPR